MTNSELKDTLASANNHTLAAGVVLLGTLLAATPHSALALGLDSLVCLGLVVVRQEWRRRTWTRWESAVLVPVLANQLLAGDGRHAPIVPTADSGVATGTAIEVTL